MQVRFRVMVNEYAAAGLLAEFGASEDELRTVGSARQLERECPLAQFEKLLRRGLIGGRDFVDVGKGWEPVARCERFAGVCRALEASPETGWWIAAGFAAAVALVVVFRLVWY